MNLIQMQQPINTSIQKGENKQTQLKYYNKVTNTSTTSPTTTALYRNFRSKNNFVLHRFYENKYHDFIIIRNISARRM